MGTIKVRRFLTMGILAGSFLFTGCSGKEKKGDGIPPDMTREDLKDTLVEENKRSKRMEREDIRNYIDRRKWEMDSTETGLRYLIYESGKGAKARRGMVARVRYDIRLLDGTVCFTTDSTGPRRIRIGRSDVTRGLQEGLTHMREGARAKLIVPSHLGFGLMGEPDKGIPMRSTLVYDVELLDLSQA